MATSLLLAFDVRAADASLKPAAARPDEEETTITFTVAQDFVTVCRSAIPDESFLGALVRQHQNCFGAQDGTVAMPEGDIDFVRLLCRFLESCHRSQAQKFNEYKVTVQKFYDAFLADRLGERAASLEVASREFVQRHLEAASGDVGSTEKAYLDAPNAPRTRRDSDSDDDSEREFDPHYGQFPYHDYDSVDAVFHTLIRRNRKTIRLNVHTHRELLEGYNAALLRHLDTTEAMSRSRVQLMFRSTTGGSGYLELPHSAGWIARLGSPSVANELRVKLVSTAFPGEEEEEGGAEQRSPACLITEGPPLVNHPRLVPGVTLWGRSSDSQQHCTDWVRLCHAAADDGDKLEVRAFCLVNVPRRRRLPDELEAACWALGDERLWAQLDFHGCDDLTFALARRVLERKSKLKTFLINPAAAAAAAAARGQPAAQPAARPAAQQVGQPGAPEVRLKQWPGKDAVQALAAWWIAATLCEAHTYTEPELYAAIEELCAMQADFAVIRKEMVRRGFLAAPEIVTNPDATTTTYYRVNGTSMRAALQGDWKTKGVF